MSRSFPSRARLVRPRGSLRPRKSGIRIVSTYGGTYLLEKGERVTTAETSAKLDRTREEGQAIILRLLGGEKTQV